MNNAPPDDDPDQKAPVGNARSAVGGASFDELEERVDQWRAAIPIPNWSLPRAQWNLLSLTEDILRLRVLSVRSEVMEPGQYLQMIDDSKYNVKYAIAHVRGLPRDLLRERPDLNDQAEYGAAKDLLEAHAQFNNAMAAFSGARAGSVRCYREPDGRYAFDNVLGFERQANDVLESRTSASDATPLLLLFQFLYQEDADIPPALAQCVQRFRAATGEPRPRIGEDVIDELDALLGTRRSLIPPQWRCAFGTGAELSRAFRTLWPVAVAHVVAVTNGAIAADGGIEPNGFLVRWLLGEATHNWLAHVLSMRGGVERASARQLLELLSYGAQTENPDPALQFAFTLRQGLLAIPWFMVATCNLERNFLTLMARVRKADFDAASAAFEQDMLADLRAALQARTWISRLSSYVPGERGAGEVDGILVDPSSAFVLVVEMRWFLEPSEVGEVRDRERAGALKARQAQRKCDAVRRALRAVLAEMGVGEDSRQWTVESVAVFDNYLPTPQNAAVPFVSHRAFLAGIFREHSLGQLWAWLRGGAWLPLRNVHFVVEPVETTLGDIEFRLDGLNPTPAGERFILDRDAAVLAVRALRPPT